MLYLSLPGDILSSAIQNTQNLLRMPFGCGEQNMALFAPNIYVLKYLNETQQLTEKIKSAAIEYLSAGQYISQKLHFVLGHSLSRNGLRIGQGKLSSVLIGPSYKPAYMRASQASDLHPVIL